MALKGTNQLDRFKRLPSDIRKYLAYTARLKREYGSVVNFIIERRLQWTDRRPKDINPFDNPHTGRLSYLTPLNWNCFFAESSHQDDIKILYNDWPYGIDEKIIHLVVWTKFELDDGPNGDDLAPLVRQKIDDYVNRTFRARVPEKNVRSPPSRSDCAVCKVLISYKR